MNKETMKLITVAIAAALVSACASEATPDSLAQVSMASNSAALQK